MIGRRTKARPETASSSPVAARRGVLGVALAFGLGVLYLCGHLVDLHLVRDVEALDKVRRFERWDRAYRAPHGTVLGRDGEVLATDRQTLDVRAELLLLARPSLRQFREAYPDIDPAWRPKRDRDAFHSAVEAFLDDLTLKLRDVPRFDIEAREELRLKVFERLWFALDQLEEEQPDRIESLGFGESVSVDVLLVASVDDPATIEALQSMHAWSLVREGDRSASKRPYRAYIHPVPSYKREITDRELMVSVLGRRHTDPKNEKKRDGVGLEAHECLLPLPDAAGVRSVRHTAGGMPLLMVPDRPPETEPQLWTTLDLDLMRRADDLLMEGVERIAERGKGPPEFGAVVLVEVATGEIVATASYTPNEDGSRNPFGAYAPMQYTFDPGSVVKPLHIALGLQRGLFDIDDVFGVSPSREDSVFTGGGAVRRIPDIQKFSELSVEGILIHSSNRGAVRLGLMLGRQGLDDYIDLYGFGESSGIQWEREWIGAPPVWRAHHRSQGKAPGEPAHFVEMNDADAFVWYGPSVCFGYEVRTSVLQIARAYLTMISGRERELRIVRGVIRDGERLARARFEGRRFLSAATRRTIFSALSKVITDGTAKHAHKFMGGREFEPGDIAGKTGTSQFPGTGVRMWNGERANDWVRTSSFAGFAPADDPQYLAVCAFQKVGASKFYGGTYAAPVAMGLLLDARAAASGAGSDRSGSGSAAAGRSHGRRGGSR